MNKTELLAPAGDPECFYAAVNAGADAVYLGGEAFGARAYAANFTTKELCGALSYAHLFGVKVYLTVNTLVKEQELPQLSEFILPFYEEGLDGVIVQDLGVLQTIRREFPDLAVHASTQMCVTGRYGAALLKKYGVKRIVPARELSLSEIIEIRERTGIEVETFIHGAMCYCYSGQCLFSSFLGGRSGNRGRCAGPCRLPYRAPGKEKKQRYLLSLKDLCGLPVLPELMDAGIDSFKIEGRMKNPVYVAGVTAVYRKYMDLYEESGRSREAFRIEPEDEALLQELYLRSETETGYYKRHSGREMLTLDSPGYEVREGKESARIKERYLTGKRQLPVSAGIELLRGEFPLLWVRDQTGSTVSVSGGQRIRAAENRPMEQAEVERRLQKTGNTPFYFSQLSVIMDEGIFLSVRELNELRREALEKLAERIADAYRKKAPESSGGRTKSLPPVVPPPKRVTSSRKGYMLSVSRTQQLAEILKLADQSRISGILLDYGLPGQLDKDEALRKKLMDGEIPLYLQLPPVFRRAAAEYCDNMLSEELLQRLSGFYCGSVDALAYAADIQKRYPALTLTADHTLYACNHEAAAFLAGQGVSGLVFSYELSLYEQKELLCACRENGCGIRTEALVYGHIPFMQTANCIKKTTGVCDKKSGWTYLIDRMGKQLPVACRCDVCENTIYNPLPLLLFKERAQIPGDTYRLAFTVEDKAVTRRLLDGFLADGSLSVPEPAHTKGHFKKGIE